MARQILIAAAVVASIVSPVRAQVVGQPTGQGSNAPANPQAPQATLPPLPSGVGSSAVAPGLTQYQPRTSSQLNAIGSNPNQSGGPAQPEGPLR
jgi:hypothetical protein